MKLFIYISLLVCVLIGSCKPSNEGSEEPEKIAVIISTLNNPWFVVLAETARDQAVALGYEAQIFDSQNNTALETDHFDNVIATGFNAILFNPTDSDGSIVNVKKASEAGIPVFCMDREINSTEFATSQILSDNYSGCVSLGKHFVQKLNKKGTYIELLGLVGDNNTWNRSNGFHSVVDRYPDIHMVAQQAADFDRNKAMQVLESLLQVHPDVDAVFCGNDAMAMGAYQALISAGKEKEVMVFGFDGATDVVESIADKKIVATGMQFPKIMARTAAEFADDYINGKRDFGQKIPVGVELVNQDNVHLYQAFGSE